MKTYYLIEMDLIAQQNSLNFAIVIRLFHFACLRTLCIFYVQPLDIVIFQPYKHYHSKAIDAATQMECSDFQKN